MNQTLAASGDSNKHGKMMAEDSSSGSDRLLDEGLAEIIRQAVRDNRSYLTVAIGCTGGQHRSVYFADWLGREFRDRARVLIRHRTLAGAL